MMTRKLRLFATDEELGKRDDDHKRRKQDSWLPTPRLVIRKRRLALFAAVLFLMWLVMRNIPHGLGDTGRLGTRSVDAYLKSIGYRSKAPAPDEAPPVEQRSNEVDDAIPHDFEGPIKFFFLAPSLHQISHTMGHRVKNKNVLFAASDLKSLSALLPLACEMSRWGRNYVHMAVMGRDEIPIEDIKRLNGAEREACNIYWHDARPDYGLFRTSKSMETSVSGALGHLETFMHPQAVIVSDADHEDYFFSKALRDRSKSLRQTLIEIPREHAESLSWLARLEAQSLHAWHTALIDIVVQAPAEASGSIIRLLQSLEAADYDGFIPPRLTVELPPKLNEATKKFLDRFDWPPRRYELLGRDSQFVLRRRIPEKRENPEEASLRFIESFYPSSSGNSHVLVLSPQAELSPIYFHYLKFYLLDYRYSSMMKREDPICGISLESPSLHLNGTGPFDPQIPKMRPSPNAEAVAPPFLWQAPNSNAALYFSDRWVEFHSYLSRHLTAIHHSRTRDYHLNRPKAVSAKYPAWMEHFLDLMRARGYTLIYPSQDIDASTEAREALVVVHNELYQPPEEFLAPSISTIADAPLPTESVLMVDHAYLETHINSRERSTTLNLEQPLLKSFVRTLPPAPHAEAAGQPMDENGIERQAPPPNPPIAALPVIDYKGSSITIRDMLERGAAMTIEYRKIAGGCSEDQAEENVENAKLGTADDLFCLQDFDEEEQVEVEVEAEAIPDQRPLGQDSRRRPDEAEVPTKVASSLRPFGNQGAAATVNAAVDWDEYKATAAAGLKQKLDTGNNYKYAAQLKSSELALTDAEKAELEDWQRRQVKEQGKEALIAENEPGVGPNPIIGKMIVREGDGNVREEPGALEPTPTARRAFPDGAPQEQGNVHEGPAHEYRGRLADAEGVTLPESARIAHDYQNQPDPYHERLMEAEGIRSPQTGPQPPRKGGIVGKMPIRYDDEDEAPIPRAQQPQSQSQQRKGGIIGKMPIQYDDEPEVARPPPIQKGGIVGKLPIRYDDEPEDPIVISGRGKHQSILEALEGDSRPPVDAPVQRPATGRPADGAQDAGVDQSKPARSRAEKLAADAADFEDHFAAVEAQRDQLMQAAMSQNEAAPKGDAGHARQPKQNTPAQQKQPPQVVDDLGVPESSHGKPPGRFPPISREQEDQVVNDPELAVLHDMDGAEA